MRRAMNLEERVKGEKSNEFREGGEEEERQ